MIVNIRIEDRTGTRSILLLNLYQDTTHYFFFPQLHFELIPLAANIKSTIGLLAAVDKF